jgi:polyisoprenoid-binding protein YceI
LHGKQLYPIAFPIDGREYPLSHEAQEVGMSTTEIAPVPTGTWSVDPVHSSVGFEVKLLGVSSYRASFGDVAGRVVFEEGVVKAIDGSVRVESLRTESPELSRRLFGDEFFDAAAHPEIQFVATGIEHAGPDRLRVAGDLAMRGIINPLTLDALVDSVRVDPIGTERVGVRARGTVDRAAYGMTWNIPAVDGAPTLAEQVEIILHVEAIRSA